MWKFLSRLLDRKSARASYMGVSLRDSLVSLEVRLQESRIEHALIGGLGLVAHGLTRATRDIDYYVLGDQEELLHGLLTDLGFETLQRSKHVSNYLLDTLRVDILYARQEIGRRMLRDAQEMTVDDIQIRALRLEDILGLKLQALRSRPDRIQDRADIQRALQEHSIDLARLREYAKILRQEDLLDEIVEQTRKT